MNDEIVRLVAPRDDGPMIFIGEKRLAHLEAYEAAAKRIAAAHRELADAYRAMDELAGQSE